MQNSYNFNISLSVLNHLGRNLYRNIITVLGEAISNSWDADAQNVYITIDRDANYMSIRDDGNGMTSEDFQNKFLKIGYSKRKNGDSKSLLGRPFIGRKGIGKLALLSCAKRVSIATKTLESETVGGIIDNSKLDEAITDDLIAQEYRLEALDDKSLVFKTQKITLENISDFFRFIWNKIGYSQLIDSNFSIQIISFIFALIVFVIWMVVSGGAFGVSLNYAVSGRFLFCFQG